MPRSDQSSQAFRVTRSGTIPPTTTQWTTCCYQAGLQEYRLNRDGIYRVLYMLSDFYKAFLNASITEQWGEIKE